MSDLNNFCRAVLEAIELPEKDQPAWFVNIAGLCFNASLYDEEYTTRVRLNLSCLFFENDYPFNEGDFFNFNDEGTMKARYKNEKRLAFLREHANIESE